MQSLCSVMTLACALLVLAVAGLPVPAAAARSGGDVVSAEAPPVGPFNRVTVSGLARVILVQGNRESVVIEAEPGTQARVRVRTSDGHLSIDAAEIRTWWNFFGFGSGSLSTITIHFRTLDVLTVSGAIQLESAGIDSPELRINASGAASIDVAELTTAALRFSGSGAVKAQIAGTATDQRIAISGAGRFQAPELRSQRADVSVSGAGRVVVNAQQRLAATISGAGTIDYYGDPELSQRITGVGKIQRRGSAATPARLHSAAVAGLGRSWRLLQ